MLILKHLKNALTCFDHYSDHLQGARRFLVKFTESYIPTNAHICMCISWYVRFGEFNKDPTSSLKMIRIMIETCWSLFKCFNINIID